MDASFKITREEILKVYAAGPEPVVALFVQQEQRITALEQELQELKKDSHDSGKPPSRDSFERLNSGGVNLRMYHSGLDKMLYRIKAETPILRRLMGSQDPDPYEGHRRCNTPAGSRQAIRGGPRRHR